MPVVRGPPLPNCDEPHKVPSGFWKIVAVEDAGTPRIAAFIMGAGHSPNVAGDQASDDGKQSGAAQWTGFLLATARCE